MNQTIMGYHDEGYNKSAIFYYKHTNTMHAYNIKGVDNFNLQKYNYIIK